MSKKSWAVTLTPLIAYLIGFAYQLVTDSPLTDQEMQLLTNLLYAFMVSGSIGGAKVIAENLGKKTP